MKILLLKPCWTYPVDPGDSTYNRNWPPLSLLNCAAVLRENGFEVQIIDASADRLGPDEVAERAQAYDMVFITSATLDRWQCPNLKLDPFLKTYFAVKKLKRPLYIMGTHGTVRSKEILAVTGADALITGEPEMTVLELCQKKPFNTIKGLVYSENGVFTRTPVREDLDLNSLPLPAYDLIDLDKYEYEVLGGRFALLEASRSCPFSCIFCVKSMYGSQYRTKSTTQFIRELDWLIDKNHAGNVYFIDLEFTVNRSLVEAVCEHLIERGLPISWCCQTRADSVDLPLLKRMKSAGCKIVHYGVETGSERIRATLKKGVSRDQIISGLKTTREAGIQTVCFFMFGLPEENIADMKETIQFAKSLNPTYASFHVALPYPETEFFQIVQGDLKGELFPGAFTGVVSYDALEKITRQAFRTYYLRPRYIAGRLKDRDFSTFFKQAKFFFSYLKARLWS